MRSTGTFCDCLRYITVWVFKDEYTRFSLKRKRSKIKQENKDMRYYDISKNIQGTRLVYVLPEYAGKFIMVSCYVNERIYIDNVTYISSFDENVLLSFLEGISPAEILFESEKNYFPIARGLRDRYDVRIIHKNMGADARISAFWILSKIM